MQVTAIKTHKITQKDTDILKILDQYLVNYQLPVFKDKSVIAVTSKIVAICEGRMVKLTDVDKDTLIEQEAQYFLPRSENKYDVSLGIIHNTLAASAGIDESNANGYYILWPKDPQESANKIREHLSNKFKIKNLGVIITDSRTTPLRWGVTAICIGYSGFLPLKSYVNKPDIFGRPFAFEKMSIMDNLACSAALVMGEGAEQTPIAVITDIPMVEFTGQNPTQKELDDIKITMDDDLYGDFLKSANWRKGKGK